jgi:hypothetical protein
VSDVLELELTDVDVSDVEEERLVVCEVEVDVMDVELDRDVV